MQTFLSFDVGGTFVKFGLINEFGEMLEEGSYETPKNYGNFLAKLGETYKKYPNINASAIAVPGVCDLKKGAIMYTPNIPYLTNRFLVADVHTFTDVHCFLANDANMAALGEFRFGEEIQYENMTLVTLGTGVGGGAVVNKKLFRGNISPCELGHITIVVDGKKCGCGKRGCFEAYCNSKSLQTYFDEITRNKHNLLPIDIYKLAKDGNILAKEAFKIFAYYLAHGLANIANIFAPEIIKIGGGLCEMKDVYMDETMKHFEKLIYPAYRDSVVVEVAKLKNRAGILGGAALCIEKLTDFV
jgi:glucokinase